MIYNCERNKKFRGKYRTDSHRMKNYDYSLSGGYFITICTKNHENFFGEIINGKMILNDIGKIVKNEWEKTGKIRENIIIDAFVIMPNHVHGILIVNNNIVETPQTHVETPRISVETPRRGVSTAQTQNKNHKPQWKSGCIGAIINQFKSICTKQIHKINSDFCWQPNYYDRIIRNEKELNRIRDYIIYNPQNWHKDNLCN